MQPKTRGHGVQHPLITWIRYRTHACTTLRVHAEDSTVTELELDRAAKNPYRKAALAALSYKPTKIEALSKNGKVLDVWEATIEDEPTPEREQSVAELGAELAENKIDSQTTQTIIFARLLSDAYKTANSFSATAFQRLVDVCNAQNERAATLERALTTVSRTTTRRTVTAQEETTEPSLLEQVVTNVVTGMALKNGAVPAPSAAGGAEETDDDA